MKHANTSAAAASKSPAATLRRWTAAVWKVAVSAALLAWLFHKAARDDSFQQLRTQPKDWPLLAAAAAVTLTAVAATIIRWYLLVRTVQLPFTLREAFRLGFLGFLLNFFTLGIVGGDAIRAVFVARQNPGRGAVAAATVVMDRVLGMFALVLLVSVAYLTMDWSAVAARDPEGLAVIQNLCRIALGFMIAGAAAMAVMLLPGFTTSPLWDALAELPAVGNTIAHLVEALRMYRQRLWIIGVSIVIGLGVHGLLAAAIYLIAHGLPGDAPDFVTHLVISPMANVFGSLPLPGGLGAYEIALDFLYRRVSPERVAESQGFVIALAFRVITLLIATIGVGYYLTARREINTLLREAKQRNLETGQPGRRSGR
ncbi:MAG: flippase-like domain-containing protein [Planctomycetes bacterium]|nr:flippase-like domain-containing protein [Planctomycetota bacterium]